MNQSVLVAVINIILGVFEIASYALLVFWSFRILENLPLEKHLKKVRFYHLLIPALVLAGLAYAPIQVIWRLIRSFPLDFSKAWIPLLVKFFEGVGFVGVLVFLCLKSRIFEGKRSGSPAVAVEENPSRSAGRVEELAGLGNAEIGESATSGKFLRAWPFSLTAAAIVLALLGGAYYYFSSQGYIVSFSLFKPDYIEYESKSPQFSFSYPSRFVIDKDEENRFGEDYLVGIKLPSDNRVGCDIRVLKGKLNLSGELAEVSDKLAQQISKGSEGFEILNSSFIEIGGEKAIKLEIVFKGPLEETMRTDQVFTSHGDNIYTMICGTTKDTYQYFVEDFGYLFEHFSWN